MKRSSHLGRAFLNMQLEKQPISGVRNYTANHRSPCYDIITIINGFMIENESHRGDIK